MILYVICIYVLCDVTLNSTLDSNCGVGGCYWEQDCICNVLQK